MITRAITVKQSGIIILKIVLLSSFDVVGSGSFQHTNVRKIAQKIKFCVVCSSNLEEFPLLTLKINLFSLSCNVS